MSSFSHTLPDTCEFTRVLLLLQIPKEQHLFGLVNFMLCMCYCNNQILPEKERGRGWGGWGWFFNLIFISYWNIADLQCCITFKCETESHSVQFSSVTQLWPTSRPHESQHPRPPCPSPTPRVHSDSCPLSQ